MCLTNSFRLLLIFSCCMTVLDYNTLKLDILHFFTIFIINKTKHTCQACLAVCSVAKSYLTLQHRRLQPNRLLCPWDFPGKNTRVGCHFLLQEIFPTQRMNPGLLHCRQTLYHLNHQGSPVDIQVQVEANEALGSASILLDRTGEEISYPKDGRALKLQDWESQRVMTFSEATIAGDQPRLIQGIRSGDGIGDLFI